jgi:hypothetical protein
MRIRSGLSFINRKAEKKSEFVDRFSQRIIGSED